jgi:hypothetical protein
LRIHHLLKGDNAITSHKAIYQELELRTSLRH